MALGAMVASAIWGTRDDNHLKPVADAAPIPIPAPKAPPPVTDVSGESLVEIDPWDGPILYRSPDSKPLHLILVEKASQKLHLYRFDGTYQRIRTYSCGTGEKRGKKQKENDEKTPEGIYFNTKIYRDTKVTVFGDRAFGLNYPNPYDRIEGNGGFGIFIHGSNRTVNPFSTNGCIALNGTDIADLDRRVNIKETPVIIGKTLPYRFNPPDKRMNGLAPFLKQAMLPEKYKGAEVSDLTLFAYGDTRVALGHANLDRTGRRKGEAKLYIAQPLSDMLVMIKREWAESKPSSARAASAPPKTEASVSSEEKSVRQTVEAWRRSWEGKQLDAYITYYHRDFSSKGKNLSAWKQYKARLNRKYKQISVGVRGLKVQVSGNTAKAYFKQGYRSDKYRSEGYKVLNFRKEGKRWKIYRETSYPKKPRGYPA
jgi:murein L,D-transpeptidase YafK